MDLGRQMALDFEAPAEDEAEVPEATEVVSEEAEAPFAEGEVGRSWRRPASGCCPCPAWKTRAYAQTLQTRTGSVSLSFLRHRR